MTAPRSRSNTRSGVELRLRPGNAALAVLSLILGGGVWAATVAITDRFDDPIGGSATVYGVALISFWISGLVVWALAGRGGSVGWASALAAGYSGLLVGLMILGGWAWESEVWDTPLGVVLGVTAFVALLLSSMFISAVRTASQRLR